MREILRGELLFILTETRVEQIPGLRTRCPDFPVWFECRRVVQACGDKDSDAWKMWLEHHKRTTVRAKTPLELAAAVADDYIIFRLVGGEFKLVERYP